jgi:hypothetical protein
MPRLPALLAAAILAAATSTAYAQSSGDRGSGSRWMAMDDQDGGRWGERGDMAGHDEQWRDHDRRRTQRDRDDGDGGERSTRADHAGMHGSGGGARFMLRAGDVRLAVQCGRGETMKDCVEATILLMDKARSQPRSGAGADASGSSSNPPATAPQQ